jgi:hypothetical protein
MRSSNNLHMGDQKQSNEKSDFLLNSTCMQSYLFDQVVQSSR